MAALSQEAERKLEAQHGMGVGNELIASMNTGSNAGAPFSAGCSTTLLGFFGVTPAVQATAYTQTYATAAKTNPAVTTHAIVDSTGGTVSTSALAALSATVTGVDGTASNAASKANVDTALGIIRSSLSTLAAEAELGKADLLALKKLVNSLIDDLQAYGLVL